MKKQDSLRSITNTKHKTGAVKSPPPKKVKDYGIMFELHLNAKLQELDLRIESKQRIIDSVPSKDWEMVPRATQAYIDRLALLAQDLNSQLVKGKKEKTENVMQNRILQITGEIERGMREKEEVNREVTALTEQIKRVNDEWISQKEKLEEECGKVSAQKEPQRTEIELKSIEEEMVKDSILQISSKLNSMKEINSHVNQRIEKINTEIQEVSKRFYEQNIYSENLAEIKKKLVEEMEQCIETEKKSYKIDRKLEMIDAFFHNKDNELEILNDLEGKINHALELIPEFQKEDSARKLEVIIKSFEEPSQRLNRFDNNKVDITNSTRIRYFQILNNIKIRELLLNAKEKQDPLIDNQCKELQQRISNGNEIVNEKLAYLQKQLEFYKTHCEILQSKSEITVKDLAKKVSTLSKVRKNYEENSEKLRESSSKISAVLNLTEQLESNVRELKDIPTRLGDNTSNSITSDREKKIMQLLLQLDALKQEVNIKDSEIVSRLRDKQRLDEKHDLLKLQLQKLNSKVKNIEAEILEKINVELESKDKQIEVLKEMLRGSSKELKVKDVVLLNYKSKLEVSSRTHRPNLNIFNNQ